MRDRGLIFNFAYTLFSAVCVLLCFIPYATFSDREQTRYTIMSSNLGTGLTIAGLFALGVIFSYFKRKKVVILISGIGLALYGFYSLSVVSTLETRMKSAVKAIQALENLSAMLGEKAVKVTYTITPVYTIFAVCAIIAGGLAAITFITTDDEY